MPSDRKIFPYRPERKEVFDYLNVLAEANDMSMNQYLDHIVNSHIFTLKQEIVKLKDKNDGKKES